MFLLDLKELIDVGFDIVLRSAACLIIRLGGLDWRRGGAGESENGGEDGQIGLE